MKNYQRLTISAVTLAFIFTFFAVNESRAQILSEIMKRMEAHSNALSSVRSKITKSTHDSVLDDYDVVKGVVNYLPGKGRNVFVRVDWKTPYQEVLVVGNGEYVLYRPSLKQAITGKTADGEKKTRSSGALAFMSMSKAELNENYNKEYIGIETVRGTKMWRLKLTPKKKTSFKYSELWVDGDGMPVQSKIVENNNDSTTILLEEIEKNVTINGSIFRLDLPKNVKIVKG